MRGQGKLDKLIEEITTDAYGYDEQLWAFLNAFEEEFDGAIDAHVLGESVEVDRYKCEGARRGLTAICLKGEETWEVSLADVVFAARSREADLVDAYRRLVGIKPIKRGRGRSKVKPTRLAR